MRTFKIILFACLILLTAQCSSNENNFESTGQIIGLDPALCACCGGWLIDIANVNESRLQFVGLPEDSDIDLESASFPLDVRFNWSKEVTGCGFVIIEEIELI